MAFALLLAVLLNQKMRGERVFRMSFYLPVILGFNTAVLLCWRLMLNTGTGIINQDTPGNAMAFRGEAGKLVFKPAKRNILADLFRI